MLSPDPFYSVLPGCGRLELKPYPDDPEPPGRGILLGFVVGLMVGLLAPVGGPSGVHIEVGATTPLPVVDHE